MINCLQNKYLEFAGFISIIENSLLKKHENSLMVNQERRKERRKE
jgi:hypothetical protein